MTDLHAGWYLLAFTSAITEELTPVTVGDRRLMIVRSEGADGPAFQVADSTCPHRGANLAIGGSVRGNCVVCPFHGRLIRVGTHPTRPSVQAYDTVHIGELLFVRFGDDELGDNGFPDAIRRLTTGREIRPAVDRAVDVPVEFVVENAFDIEHFPTVHGVPSLQGMVTERAADGTLSIGGDFMTMADPWYDLRYRKAAADYLGGSGSRAAHRSAFRAVAFSPTVVATSFGSGTGDPIILTGALPTPDGTQVRVAVIGDAGQPLDYIVDGSRLAISQDCVVWANLDPDATWDLGPEDVNVVAFRDFVAHFPLAPARRRQGARV